MIVYLADLRHSNNGVLFADTMPLGIGYMKAVIDQYFDNKVQCEIFAYTEDFNAALSKRKPDVVMFTNYMWNEQLGLHYFNEVKKIDKNILTVMGGPNISIDEEEQKDFILKNPQIDLYVLGEGDFIAKDILVLFLQAQKNIYTLKENFAIPSCIYFNNRMEFVKGGEGVRYKNLNEIPSPWLNGIMDKFFDGKLSPLYETNRGCPFTCTFCVQGTRFYTKVTYFDLERVEKELWYIAKKIASDAKVVKILRIADPNFGMYERDIEISKTIGKTQKEYGYPTFIEATTGKNKPERIIKAMEEVSGALIMWQSVQSLDDNVLENIKRKNIDIDTYHSLNVYLIGRGLRSQADLILGLPGETLESHKKALENLTNAQVSRFNNFQAMLLKGSEMATKATRKKFGLNSKFRLIQKNFSEQRGEKIFEIEEIVVTSDTFSKEDYVISRKYHLLINLFLNELRFEEILSLIDSLQIKRWDWIQLLYESIEDDDFIRNLFDAFIADTNNELFDTTDSLLEFYKTAENYEKLVTGEIGDNVLHKYRVISCFIHWQKLCDFAFKATQKLVLDNGHFVNDSNFGAFWSSFNKHHCNSRISGTSVNELLSETVVELEYDISKWVADNYPKEIGTYKLTKPLDFVYKLSDFNYLNISDSLKRWDIGFFGLTIFIRKIKQHWMVKDCMITVAIEGTES